MQIRKHSKRNKKIVDGCVEIILEEGRPLPTSTLTSMLRFKMPKGWLPKSTRVTANVLAKCDYEKKLRLVPEDINRPKNKRYLWTVRDEWRDSIEN